MTAAPKHPNWADLRAIAAVQGGFFQAKQAGDVGFSPQLLARHVGAGTLVHPRRGIYRLAQFPPVDNEDLVELWLWSDQEGVFSHETALALHDLSDALPARIHMTVPRAWRTRRRATPPILILHHADLAEADRTWVGLIPVTTPPRTLRDAYDSGVDPAIIGQAVRDGATRRLFSRADLRGIVPSRVGRPSKGLRPRARPRPAA